MARRLQEGYFMLPKILIGKNTDTFFGYDTTEQFAHILRTKKVIFALFWLLGTAV